MNNMLKSISKNSILIFVSLLVISTSVLLGLHNASLYNHTHGFDGTGHYYYIEFIYDKGMLPEPSSNWETHQPPLYYLIGAGAMHIFGTMKSAQYINTFVLWAIIGISGLGLWRVFHNKIQTLIGMLSIAALPMLNIFPAMITNELLSTLWILSALVAGIYVITEENKKKITKYLLWMFASIVLGWWTKVSIVLIIPSMLMVLALFIHKYKKDKKLLTIFALLFMISVLFSLPSLLRIRNISYVSNLQDVEKLVENKRPLDFYYRLDWIPKVDMYTTQYYSLSGAAWNSFWSDGHNAITPFVEFHKKAFILWTLGFVLFPLSLYGLYRSWSKSKRISLYMIIIGTTMLGMYIYYNYSSDHYSSARLTYQMGIVLPYAFGIASAMGNKKLKYIIVIILSIQFLIMVSFYWIQPWWHVTR